MVTILTDKHTHKDMANKYDGEEQVNLVLNCKRATEFVEQNKTRLPSEEDLFRLQHIITQGGVYEDIMYNKYSSYFTSFKVRRLFEKRVYGGMNEAEIDKFTKSLLKAGPFIMFSEAVCKLLMDWLYAYHNLKPNYDLEKVFGKLRNVDFLE